MSNDKLSAALAHARAGRLGDAERILRDLQKDAPDTAQAHNLMARLFEQLGNAPEAYAHHKRAVTLDPATGRFWRDFGQCLHTSKQDEAAVVAYQRAAALLPDDAECHRELATAHSVAGDVEAAIAAFERSLALRPDSAITQTEMGCQLQILGDFAGARARFEQALCLDPDLLEAQYQLTLLGESAGGGDAAIAHLERALAAPGLTSRQRVFGLFALARLHDGRKDHDAAFECYAAANDTVKRQYSLDRADCRSFHDASIAGFPAETFERLRDAGSHSRLPIFIIGMPRSGTTLVEQILSSHPKVFAGGESRKIGMLANELVRPWSETVSYPRDAALLPPQRLAEMGQLYLAHVRSRVPGDATRVTDKQPFNFVHLGLIAVLFPNAAVVHCRRDPMDTCLSCYFQNFTESGVGGLTNDLEDLGFLYGEYRRLMDHWRSVLPVRILDVDYEELVRSQEAVSRRLVEFAGLEWDDACLDFHEKEGGVNTASMWQVRQPIYTSSLGRWRRYEKHLGPLKRALANAV